jgi:hypothetical protein
MSQHLVTPPIVTSGLVWYTDFANSLGYFNSSSFGYLKDLSGNGNNIILSGSNASNIPVTNSYGGWIDFANGYAKGVSGSVIPALDNLTSATWNFWLRPRPVTPDFGIILGKQDGDISSGWFIRFATSASVGYDGLGFNIVAPTDMRAYISTGSYVTASFSNIAVVWDGNFNSPTGSAIYINGIKIPFLYTLAGNGTRTSDAGYPLSIASGYGAFNSGMSSGLGPTMIYNRALSQAEVVQNYNAHKSRFGLT